MRNPLEYCSKCGGTRNASITIGMVPETQPDGTEALGIVIHLHCSSCNSYLRSFSATEGQPLEGLNVPHQQGLNS
jgi:hypothetical protein